MSTSEQTAFCTRGSWNARWLSWEWQLNMTQDGKIFKIRQDVTKHQSSPLITCASFIRQRRDRCGRYCTKSLCRAGGPILICPLLSLWGRSLQVAPCCGLANSARSRRAAVLPGGPSWIWRTALSENKADKQCNPRRSEVILWSSRLCRLSSISARLVEYHPGQAAGLSDQRSRVDTSSLINGWQIGLVVDDSGEWRLNALHAPCRCWWGSSWRFSSRFYCLLMAKQPDLLLICSHP